MDGYQPPLLSLGEMLNLPGNEDCSEDDWANNPFNISNFFEPIVTPSQSGPAKEVAATAKAPQTGDRNSDYGAFQTSISVDPFEDFNIVTAHQENVEDLTSVKNEPTEMLGDPLQEDDPATTSNNTSYQDNSKDDFLNFDVFDEEMVTSELQDTKDSLSSSDAANTSSGEVILPDNEPVFILPTLTSSPQKAKGQKCSSPVATRKKNIPGTRLSQSVRFRNEGPSLKEVTLEDVSREESKTKCKLDMERKYRNDAVSQLNSLIDTLKRYRNQLENFLDQEGDMILEQYTAKTLLRGILPDITEPVKEKNPFYEAHSITSALIQGVKGRTVLSTLPPRRPYLWRGSDLLLLQKTILESVMHQREFFLYCRYTDLLTQMGFDSEDLDRLHGCPTKEVEMGAMKIILNEHNFFSQLKGSHKQPIQTTIIKRGENGNEVPRVYVFPSPEKLVEDKWTALLEIRRRTVLARIEDKDICWLYVLKKLADKNPRLNNVDEETCKLTYDHLLSYKYNSSPWHRHELEELQKIRNAHPNISWEKTAELLGTKRSAFTCFVKFKTHCMYRDFTPQPMSTENMNLVRNCFDQCLGNVSRVDFMLSRVLKVQYHWIKPYSLIMFAQKTMNPRIRKGMFSVVEDVLLLVVTEKYKRYMLDRDLAMEPVAYALPWRYSTTWKKRLQTLFTTFYTRMWTLEEDKRLWTLLNEYGPNYMQIQRHFPHKNRKQCRQRYMTLLNTFETTKLEDYHLIYNSKRDIDLKRLHIISEYLELTIRSKLSGSVPYVRESDLEFLKLRRTPTDNNLESYLMTFSVSLMNAALERLSELKTQIVTKWTEVSSKDKDLEEKRYYERVQGFNRRYFDPQCPVSIASALHLRFAKLVPEDTIDDLTEFEREIYTAFKCFSIRRGVKKITNRRNIPTLEELRKLKIVSRIIQQSQVVHKPGQPSVVVTIKSEIPDEEDKERENQDLLQELEERRLGGQRKGGKRKRTRTKESRKRAAMIRWQNQKESTIQECGSPLGSEIMTIKENIPSDCHSDIADSPMFEVHSPATPASMISTVTESDSIAGTGPSMRKAILGMLSDHAYIHPMDNPGDLACLTLPQLFAKMGGGKGKQSRTEKK